MNGQCGLINKNNACRCARKTRTFVNAGFVDRNNLKFQRDRVASIDQVAPRAAGVVFEKLTNDYAALYRKHPFSDPQELAARLSTMLEATALGGLLPSSRD